MSEDARAEAQKQKEESLRPTCTMGKDCSCVHGMKVHGVLRCTFRRHGARLPRIPCDNLKLPEERLCKDKHLEHNCPDPLLYKGCVHLTKKVKCDKVYYGSHVPEKDCPSFKKKVRCSEGLCKVPVIHIYDRPEEPKEPEGDLY